MKAGDHIRILRPGGPVHAIDVGDRTVIHFEEGAGVRRSRLGDLAGEGTVEVVTHAVRTYSPKQVVARAFSRFAEAAYASMFADSEAFAVWCEIGHLRAPAAAVSRASDGAPQGRRHTATPRGKKPPARRARKSPARRPAKAAAASGARSSRRRAPGGRRSSAARKPKAPRRRPGR